MGIYLHGLYGRVFWDMKIEQALIYIWTDGEFFLLPRVSFFFLSFLFFGGGGFL